jgi:hypothetical protein
MARGCAASTPTSALGWVIAGHALAQNLRHGHYELAVDQPVQRRVAVAFDELATAKDTTDRASPLRLSTTQQRL